MKTYTDRSRDAIVAFPMPLRPVLVILTLVVAACGSRSNATGGEDSGSIGGDGSGGMRFGIVGDTRPANPGDTAGYPTEIITKIWQDMEAESPRVPFAISTGDYMFANNADEVTAQLAIYMHARAEYTGVQYPVMGNHECTGATASNCGPGADGMTPNYTGFLGTMLAPIGVVTPYYIEHIVADDTSWTAKFIFIACNAWDETQATWLTSELAKPTTYTFVVRHEGTNAVRETQCGESQSIIEANPLTLLIVGHTHTYSHYKTTKEIVVGIGGAPLTSGTNYGYAVVARNLNGTLTIRVYNYLQHALIDIFAIQPSGDPA